MCLIISRDIDCDDKTYETANDGSLEFAKSKGDINEHDKVTDNHRYHFRFRCPI